MKFLFLVILAGIVWVAWKKSRKQQEIRRSPERPAEAMVACAHCGVLLPVSDSVVAGGLRYCSRAHLEAGPARPGA